jgi:hypothetical protein
MIAAKIEWFLKGLRHWFLLGLWSVIAAALLWAYILMMQFGVSFSDLQNWLHLGLNPTPSIRLPMVILYCSLAIGIQGGALFYFCVGWLWDKHGDVHNRGAKVEQGSL